MSSLPKYATFGGLACLGLAFFYRTQMNLKIRNAKYFKDTMLLLNDHKASELLGKPIFNSNIDVFSTKNFADANKAMMYIPVRGSKRKGELYFSASNSDGNWSVNRVELEVKDDINGTVLIFDKDRGSVSSDGELNDSYSESN